MSSILLADNGVSSGAAGLKSSADGTGTLALQTTTASGTATTAVLIDNAQNVGVGVTPSAWYSFSKVIQAGQSGALETRSNSNVIALSANQYIDTAGNYKYITTDYATRYYQTNGQHIWQTAASGTAGNAITFTQAMTLDSSGRLLVGTTSSIAAAGILQVNTGKFLINSTNSSFGQFQIGNATSNGEASIQFISNVATFGETPTSTSGDNYCWNIGAGNYSIGGDSFGIANKGNAGINVKLAYNSSSWISVSDERIKDIQSDITNAYEIVKDWRTVYYTLKSDPLKITKIGLLAQDVQKTLPAAVDIPKTETDDKGKLNPWGVHYTDVIPVLVKAIQEQQALIQSLTDRLTALEGAAK